MKLLSTITALFASAILLAQGQLPFTPIAEQDIVLSDDLELNLPLSQYQTFELDKANLQASLANAALESEQNIKTASNYIRLPLPNGEKRQFRLVESPVMQSELQARWPQLRTYRLVDTEDSQYYGRLAYTPFGVNAVFQSEIGNVFIEPYVAGQNRYHIIYQQKDIAINDEIAKQLSCGFDLEEHAEEDDFESIEDNHNHTTSEKTTNGEPAQIREFLLALTCTGEYAVAKGQTVESVLASFVTAVNLANLTFEQEVGVRATLFNQEEDIIFLYPATDPFINSDEGGALLSQIQNAIVNVGGVSPAAYDMGHVFTGGCTDVGGVVSGRVCTASKDRAVTCHYSSSISAIVNRVMVHEVAHHFSVGHTFSNCPGNEGQTATESAFEPGSGSTIMSYAGACGNQNIQGDSDTYYHSYSLDEFIYYTREGTGSTCATILETTNTEPELSLDYTDGFYIPISTPFELNGHATDMENDNMTYCWEQLNLGFLTPLGMPTNNAPLFRSFPPNNNTNRYFPRIQNIINNVSDDREMLPTYSRDLTFRFAVRDNNPEVGASVWQDVAFHSTSSAGPFLVLEPNSNSVEWRVGEYREVQWDVANTDNDIVNCQRVNIRLSTDGGYTYPITLVEDVPNTGSAFVSVPDAVGNNMRIRVEAANNVFFDISNANFSIQEATQATYTLDFAPAFQQVCLPSQASVAFNTNSILGYDSLVNISVSSQLPAGIEASFSQTSFNAGQDTDLSLDLSNLENFHGHLPITVQAVAPSLDTFYRTFILDIVDNDFEELELLTPTEGQAGITLNTNFSWEAVANADSYDWQLSDDAAFSNILASETAYDDTSILPNVQLEANTLFYWRIRANNACGTSDWRPTQVFHTINNICTPEDSQDTPISIPGTGPPPTRISELYVPFDGVISDMNVSYINVTYNPIQNFRVTLTSPEGTDVILYDQSCFSSDLVNVGFDDEAPNDLVCPPTGQFSYQPAEPLSAFIGENSQGTWTLTVKVFENGFGSSGTINDWAIEFCADGNAAAPNLITNETLFVQPLMGNPITSDLLHISDPEQGPEELTYTIVSAPAHGQLYRVDTPLEVGSTFRQATINALNLTYVNTDADATDDHFDFVVQDGTGGFLPIQRFNIRIDEDAVTSTQELSDELKNFKLYPNPTSNRITIEWEQELTNNQTVRVFNAQGQLMYQNTLAKASNRTEVSMKAWPAGIYFVQLGAQSTRVVKQ